MKYLIIIIALFLIGCENNSLVLTDKERAAVQERVIKKGEARHAVFVECMELAAKMPRQQDDDVADIVDACSTEAHYITNYLR